MTLSSIQQGQVITVRVYKTFGGYVWANNYEVQATQDVSNTTILLPILADRFVTLERALHSTAVTIDRVTISTYAPDSLPYNPDALATYAYNVAGQRSVSGDHVALEVCLFVRRITNFGRNGRILYRGCLFEADVGTFGYRGIIISSALTAIRSIINNWTQQGIGPEWRLVLASGNPQPTNIREVIRLEASEKVVFKKLSNRYFRRRR